MILFNKYIALKPVSQFKNVLQPMGTKDTVIYQGQVVGVDPDIKTISVEDVLVFPSYAHHIIKINGEDYIFVKEEEVICKL